MWFPFPGVADKAASHMKGWVLERGQVFLFVCFGIFCPNLKNKIY
jgi:hypothetical protein